MNGVDPSAASTASTRVAMVDEKSNRPVAGGRLGRKRRQRLHAEGPIDEAASGGQQRSVPDQAGILRQVPGHEARVAEGPPAVVVQVVQVCGQQAGGDLGQAPGLLAPAQGARIGHRRPQHHRAIVRGLVGRAGGQRGGHEAGPDQPQRSARRRRCGAPNAVVAAGHLGPAPHRQRVQGAVKVGIFAARPGRHVAPVGAPAALAQGQGLPGMEQLLGGHRGVGPQLFLPGHAGHQRDLPAGLPGQRQRAHRRGCVGVRRQRGVGQQGSPDLLGQHQLGRACQGDGRARSANTSVTALRSLPNPSPAAADVVGHDDVASLLAQLGCVPGPPARPASCLTSAANPTSSGGDRGRSGPGPARPADPGWAAAPGSSGLSSCPRSRSGDPACPTPAGPGGSRRPPPPSPPRPLRPAASASADCSCRALSMSIRRPTPAGRRQADRSGDEGHLRAQAGGGARQGEAHLSRTSDCPGSERRPRASWVGPAVTSTWRPASAPRGGRPAQHLAGGGDDLGRVDQPARPNPAAGQLALVGTDRAGPPACQQPAQVVLGQRVVPHVHVHGRRQQHRAPGWPAPPRSADRRPSPRPAGRWRRPWPGR